jgi:hypothetical protein
MEGPSADSVEKHEPASDVDTVVVDSLKALDPNRPIREATEAHYGNRCEIARICSHAATQGLSQQYCYNG